MIGLRMTLAREEVSSAKLAFCGLVLRKLLGDARGDLPRREKSSKNPMQTKMCARPLFSSFAWLVASVASRDAGRTYGNGCFSGSRCVADLLAVCAPPLLAQGTLPPKPHAAVLLQF